MATDKEQRTKRNRLLLLGKMQSAEMAAVIRETFAIFRHAEIRRFPTLPLPESIEIDWNPELIIICQNRPDEYSREDVLHVIRRFPLARCVCCFGLWCESDGRNRDIWPVGVRVPARLARSRLLRERDVLEGRNRPLPLTAGRDEAFGFAMPDGEHSEETSVAGFPRLQPLGGSTGLLQIPRQQSRVIREDSPAATVISPDRELRLCFEDRLRSAGCRMTVSSGDATPDVILFDADPWTADRAAGLRRLREDNDVSTMISLMTFSRPEDVAAVFRCGADAVLPKLANTDDLLRVVQDAQQPVAGTLCIQNLSASDVSRT